MNLEIEVKFSVPTDFEFGGFGITWNNLTVEKRQTKRTFTTYFDTEGRDLLACGAALRFRSSQDIDCEDEGTWTLKFSPPSAEVHRSSRFEFEIRAGGGRVPPQYDLVLQVFGASNPGFELAMLKAERSATVFSDSQGRHVIELDDDFVTVQRGTNEGSTFREIEVEVIDHGYRTEAEAIIRELLDAGASFAVSSSKLEQAIASSETRPYLTGLFTRYRQEVVADLNVFAGLVVESAENGVVLGNDLARALVVELSDETAKRFAEETVFLLAVNRANAGRQHGPWFSGAVARLCVDLAGELREGGSLSRLSLKFPSRAARRVSEIVLQKIVVFRDKGDEAISACTMLIEDLNSLPWKLLNGSDEVPVAFERKWS